MGGARAVQSDPVRVGLGMRELGMSGARTGRSWLSRGHDLRPPALSGGRAGGASGEKLGARGRAEWADALHTSKFERNLVCNQALTVQQRRDLQVEIRS
jgi:hypothetical protein